MLTDSKLIAFAATARPDKAMAFYSEVLGFPLLEDTPFALVFNMNGQTLRVQKVERVVPPPYTILGWEVENIGSATALLVKRGVTMERFEALEQDEFAVWTAPDGTSVAWFRDPDGNLLSMTQER